MKKIFGLVLALVLLVSVFAILPVAAENVEENGVYLHLDNGITFYYVSEGGETPKHIAAKEIGNLQDFGDLGSYSVQDYLKRLITDDSKSQVTKNIAQALLNYGAAAYNYFNARDGYTGTPVDGTPEPNTDALVAAEAPDVVIEDNSNIYLGATLILDGEMQLRFYFEGNGVKVEYEDNTLHAVDKGNNTCYVDIPVFPYEMAEPKVLMVYDHDTTIKYAPLNYLKAMAGNNELAEIVASIYAYGVAAEDYIQEVCEHADIKLDIIKPATLFTTGITNNVCELCGKVVDTEVTTGARKTEHYTSETHGVFGEKVELSTVLGDNEHFYGEDAKKLYVEFSILWNPSLLNYVRLNSKDQIESYMYMGMFAGANAEKDRRTSFHLALDENCNGFWCKHIGGFEPSDNKSTVDGVYTYPDENGKVTDFPNIGNYGWHRIGYEFEQTTDPETGMHDVTVYLYIDGVKLSGYKVLNGVDNNNANLLYTADVVDGELVYTGDVKSGTYMWAFAFANNGKADGDMYFTYADVFVTAGDGFVMPVEKVSDPEYATFSPAAGVTFNASTYFKPVGDDNCAHEHTAAGVTTTAPTLFADGAAAVICTDCGKTVDGSITLPKIDGVAVETFTPGANVQDIFGAKVNIVNDVLKGDTFSPTEENPDGKSMYVEFSLLWNETLKNVYNGKDRYVQIGTIGDMNATKDGKRITPYFLIFNQTEDAENPMWCQFAGGFETDNNTTNVIGDPVVSGQPADYYEYIGDYGWHRIGIEYTQVTEIKSGKVYYTLYATLYVDGAAVLKYQAIKTTTSKDANLLYTAEIVDGELGNFKDIADDRYVYAYRFGVSHESVDEAAYFVVKDASVTCGTDFVMNVAPNADPEDATFTKDGITLPGKQHFDEIVIDCENGIHAWANEPTVDVAPTCTTEGSKSVKCLACGAPDTTTVEPIDALGHTWDTKYTVDKAVTCEKSGWESIKCTVCNETKPDSGREIPAAGQHVWPEDITNCTIVIAPTVFSEGVREGICTICGETFTGPIEKTKADRISYTTTTVTQYSGTANIGEALGDKTFQPGNDLLLEFSVLLNSATDNIGGSGFGFGHIAKDNINLTEGNLDKVFSWFYYKPSATWCPFKGGFEFSGAVKKFYGPEWIKSGERDNYVVIENYDGWHRFGLRYTQNYYEETDTYDVTVTVYVDGNEVNRMDMDWGHYFYSVEHDGDKVNYIPNTTINDYYAVFYFLESGKLINSTDPDVHFFFADLSLSVGSDFVMDVSPRGSEAETEYFTQDGITLYGKRHFKINDPACTAGDHLWADEATVDVPATAINEGSKSVKCLRCKAIKEGTVVSIPKTDDAVLNPYTTTTKTPYSATGNIGTAITKSGKTFQPGNDLFLEFSVLLNNTTDDIKGEGFGFGHLALGGNLEAKAFSWFYYRPSAQWSGGLKGAFEFSNTKTFTYGPVWKENGKDSSNFVQINPYDGWHRFGLQYTQNVYEDANGNFTYDVTITVYVDGVMVSQGIVKWDAMFYSAKREGGEIVYTQNPDIGKYDAVFYNIASGSLNAANDPYAYFPFADFYLTVGDRFVLDVSPATETKTEDYTLDGVTFEDVEMHFVVNN